MFTWRLARSGRLRSMVLTAALGLASLAVLPASAQGTSAVETPSDTAQVKPTVVLVHGAWADASSWTAVILSLQAAGYTVVAPPNPLRSVSEDSAYLANFLKTISGPVVLVGHSYGGAVITNGATGNPNIRALVYVDAFIPAQGEGVLQLFGPESCLAGAAVDPTKVFNFVQDPALPVGDYDTFLRIDATSVYPGFSACFANGLSSRKSAELAATQRGAALSIAQPSGVPAWRTIPSWDLIGTQDHVIPASAQLAMARRAGAHVSEFDAGHLGLISEPDAVVEVILNAIRATE